ncbi:MAG: hypothetical protein KDA28_14310 [Phycisphaerales bacterium]|nr:hypothetical protein [Phycisphaerales bacterium]
MQRRTFIGTAAAGLGLGATSVLGARAQEGRVPAPLKILVLGGTGQTGPHFIRRAIAHGHEVTMFNRGNRSAEMFPDVECLIGDRYPDRGEGLASLRKEIEGGRKWDIVLDTWPHLPFLVGLTADLLKNAADRYMYISSISVYTDNATRFADESAEVGSAPNADDLEFTMQLYGPFKAECENRVRRFFPGERHTIYRPGLIVGPRDFSYRGVYWPVRIRDGGEVLAPGDGSTPTQIIDGRDLAEFELLCMERGHHGTYNVTGPHPNHPLDMKRLLETCRRVSGSDATFTWVPAEFLEQHGVGAWMNMPCWIPTGGEYDGFGTRSIARAVAAGLTFRPLTEIVEDTIQWYDSLDEVEVESVRHRAGIPREKETEVLDAWRNRDGG